MMNCSHISPNISYAKKKAYVYEKSGPEFLLYCRGWDVLNHSLNATTWCPSVSYSFHFCLPFKVKYMRNVHNVYLSIYAFVYFTCYLSSMSSKLRAKNLTTK